MVLNKKKEQESSMLEAYNHILEISTLTTNKELNQEPNIPRKNPNNDITEDNTDIPQTITEDNTDIPQSSPNPITL